MNYMQIQRVSYSIVQGKTLFGGSCRNITVPSYCTSKVLCRALFRGCAEILVLGRNIHLCRGELKKNLILSVLLDMFDILTSLKIGTQVVCRQVPTHEQSPQQEEPSMKSKLYLSVHCPAWRVHWTDTWTGQVCMHKPIWMEEQAQPCLLYTSPSPRDS